LIAEVNETISSMLSGPKPNWSAAAPASVA
jgi:hypothetical protein